MCSNPITRNDTNSITINIQLWQTSDPGASEVIYYTVFSGGFSLPAPVVTACHPEPIGDSLLPLRVCKCCQGERQLSPLAFPTGDRALLCERQMPIMHCVKKYCLTLFCFFFFFYCNYSLLL